MRFYPYRQDRPNGDKNGRDRHGSREDDMDVSQDA